MIAPVKHRLLNILLADDGSLNAHAAVKFLSDMPHDQETMVTILRVFTPLEAAEYADVEESLAHTKNLLKSRHLHYRSETRLGYPTEKIIEFAHEQHPDLIVMGAKGTGANLGLLLGSVAMNIVHDGRWPVLVVREPVGGLKHILLVTDGSPCSQLACDYMGVFPLPKDVKVEVLHVLPQINASYLVDPMGITVPTITDEQIASLKRSQEAEGQKVIDSSLETLTAQGLNAHSLVMRGEPADTIINHARDQKIDLIVCGSRGYGTVTSMLVGSVSRQLAHHAPSSVLVVRCQGQEKG
jgi:nucleotide-binding universal stress UspA family protein